MALFYTKLHPNVQTKKGPGKARFAPHKPLLLLSIIDLAESGDIELPVLHKTAALRLRFDAFWAICQPRWGGAPGLDLPFHYLQTQKFWKALTKEGTPSPGPDSTHAVELCDEFVDDLASKKRRDEIRRLLVETWFPEAEQGALYAALGFSKAKLAKLKVGEEPPNELEAVGRDARFRVAVVTQYQFTCALTGYGLHTARGHSLVEAAHIHVLSKRGGNAIRNGLALTRDAHWMFDKGLWTISPDLRAVVAEEVFTEWGPEARWLQHCHNQPLVFREGVTLRPNEEKLAWHREHVFLTV